MLFSPFVRKQELSVRSSDQAGSFAFRKLNIVAPEHKLDDLPVPASQQRLTRRLKRATDAALRP
ncbi:hypothetical protein ABC383_01845 [Noviherbaspirillum sp. 1P10PC]|uniref:hypothetical protein n=1 Tax=Noviherbaspirillum sp. 1P10PC TaxID=3132292 RepID=UPI0039A2C4F8